MSFFKTIFGKRKPDPLSLQSPSLEMPPLGPMMRRETTLATQGVHEKEARRFFGENFEFKGAEFVNDGPLICLGFTNRSGSNLLGGYLRAQPGLLGFHEQLNYPPIIKQSKELGIDSFPNYIAQLSAKRPKAAHGVKASVEQLMMLQRANIPAMYKGGLKLIQIRREDLIGQAISHHIALQTLAWTSRTETNVPKAEIVFDAERISRIAKSIRHSEFLMDIFVETYKVPRLQISYSELTETPLVSLNKVAKFLKKAPSRIVVPDPILARQSNALNDEFRARYRQEVLLEGLD